MKRCVCARPDHGTGLLLLAVTAIGWGLNWPGMKLLLQEWPPLSARGTAGIVAAVGLAALTMARGQSLAVPRGEWPRLAAAAAINVTAWMGLSTLAMQWLSAGEGALVVYTMPIWATLLAWPVLGERPTLRRLAALALGVGGIALLFGGAPLAMTPERLLGVGLALGAAVLFAFGTVTMRRPLALPPLASVAWQVGLGCLPMLAFAAAFEQPRLDALSATGIAVMVYMTVVPMGVCYLTWFAALHRLPPATAAVATLITPVVGVVSAALTIGEPLGARQLAALALTLTGVALALRGR
jgi:drug/metabolite transporter (DMT)-like permease